MAKTKTNPKYAIAVDLGATNLRVAIGDENGKFIAKVKEKTVRKGNENAIGEQVVEIINSLKKPKNIIGVGIGSVGSFDFKKGAKLIFYNNAIGEINLNNISKGLKLPIFILNDCNAGVLGEKIFGIGKKYKNLIYITISSGIGAGAIASGKLILGRDGSAMEAGHMVMDYESKMKCDCGKKGHWEAYCSAGDMPKYFKVWLKENKKQSPKGKISAEIIFERAKKGDKITLDFIDELGKINAVAIANLIDIFNPGLITLGGAVVLGNKRLILEPLKKYIKDYSYNPIPEIKITPLGQDIILYGALSAVFSNIGFKV